MSADHDQRLPPHGGTPLQHRPALVAARLDFIPEITGMKFTSKEFGKWRDDPPFAYDPHAEYGNKYGVHLNTAIRLTGALVADIDVDDPDDVENIVAVFHRTLGETPCRRYRQGSARTALLYRALEDIAYAGLQGSDGAIEIFSGPRAKLTSFGLHTDKTTKMRTPLEWRPGVPGNVSLADLPGVTEYAVLDALAGCADYLGDGAEVKLIRRNAAHDAHGALPADDIDEVCRALAAVPNTGVQSWHDTNRIGMAIYAATNGDERGLIAYAEWCLSNPHTAHRDWMARWENYSNSPPTAIGAGTIYRLALANGFVPQRSPAATAAWRQRQRNNNWHPKV